MEGEGPAPPPMELPAKRFKVGDHVRDPHKNWEGVVGEVVHKDGAPTGSVKVQWTRKGGKEVQDSKVSRQACNGSKLELFTPGTRVLDRPPGKCALTREQTDALAAAIITRETWGPDEQQQARARQCLRRHGLEPDAFYDKWSTKNNHRMVVERKYVYACFDR